VITPHQSPTVRPQVTFARTPLDRPNSMFRKIEKGRVLATTTCRSKIAIILPILRQTSQKSRQQVIWDRWMISSARALSEGRRTKFDMDNYLTKNIPWLSRRSGGELSRGFKNSARLIYRHANKANRTCEWERIETNRATPADRTCGPCHG
jgi:hypothetical protein